MKGSVNLEVDGETTDISDIEVSVDIDGDGVTLHAGPVALHVEDRAALVAALEEKR